MGTNSKFPTQQASVSNPGGNVEMGVIEWPLQPTERPVGGKWEQSAPIPQDSILAKWRDVAREQVEGADAYIVGSILPVCAALLARRVWFQWGDGRQYPNLFALLAGKPGDRKSSTIKLAEALARRLLPDESFLPANFSPEAMFDQYTKCPDRIYIMDEGNTVLADWQKGPSGERVAARFLELYDCKPLSEAFRRNLKEDGEENAMRNVKQTSTSVLFGATFNIAAFQGQAVQAGIARRFLYYCADGLGRIITMPSRSLTGAMDELGEAFRVFLEVGGEMVFTREARAFWDSFQHANRAAINESDPTREEVISRLSSAPMQVLSIAMIFQIARHGYRINSPALSIEAETLDAAVRHVEGCLNGAEFLESIRQRARIESDAEILLASIRHNFKDRTKAGSIQLTRSELTRSFANNTRRRGSWKPADLYHRIIPALERQGFAKLVRKTPAELYAFRAGD